MSFVVRKMYIKTALRLHVTPVKRALRQQMKICKLAPWVNALATTSEDQEFILGTHRHTVTHTEVT